MTNDQHIVSARSSLWRLLRTIMYLHVVRHLLRRINLKEAIHPMFFQQGNTAAPNSGAVVQQRLPIHLTSIVQLE